MGADRETGDARPETPVMPTILLVEDSLTQATQFRLMLKKAGFDVLWAENGRLALDVLASHAPELVLTYMQMAELDGLQLVEAMRRKHPRTPVVLMTQHGSEDLALRALRKGAASYLPKSLLDRSMLDTLEEILERTRQTDRQHRVRRCVVERVVKLKLESDPSLIPSVAAFVERELEEAGFGDATARMQVGVALRNAMEVAVFHGNLGLDSEARLESELTFREAAEQRRGEEPYSGRSLWLTVRVQPDIAECNVRHEGEPLGGQWHLHPDDLPDLEDPLRRSLLLMHTLMDEVRLEDSGSEIVMRKRPADPTDPTDEPASGDDAARAD
jgi:CheY-like chemotaxis protein